MSLKDAAGAKVTTGTTELRVYRLEDDGTLDVYDWTTNDFVATGSGTPDDETTMTHRQRRDSTGADVDTGVWTAVLTTLTNWVEGQVYLIQITNTNATPESQEREFQFGGVEGSDAFSRATNAITVGVVDTGATQTSIPTSSLSPAATATDQFKGQILCFDKDTTTAALRGQKTNITASTSGGTLTVAALSNSPASGDRFTIQ